MEEPVFLKSYLSYHHDEETYQKLFYGLHLAVHKLYQKQEFVPLFDMRNSVFLNQVLDTVLVEEENPRKVMITHKAPISKEYQEFAKKTNIEFLASLMATVYIAEASMGFNPNRGLFNLSVLEQNFDACSFSFPNSDVPYFRQVLLEKNYSFYDEYLQVRKGSTNQSLQQSRQYVKSNGVSVISSDEEMPSFTKDAGYSRIVFLVATFMTTLLLLGFIVAVIVLS